MPADYQSRVVRACESQCVLAEAVVNGVVLCFRIAFQLAAWLKFFCIAAAGMLLYTRAVDWCLQALEGQGVR